MENRSQRCRDVELIIGHIQDWWRNAKLGDRRVVAKEPLSRIERSLVQRCKSLGMVYADEHGRHMLEKITRSGAIRSKSKQQR